MMSCSGVSRFGVRYFKFLVPGFLLISTISVGGCSADVTRFDNASFNLNDPPVPPEDVRTGSVNDNAVSRSSPRGPYGAGASSVEVAPLPSVASAPNYATPSYSSPAPTPAKSYGYSGYNSKPFAPGRKPSTFQEQAALGPPRASAPLSPASHRGQAVEVRQGDTLYGISRRYSVSVSELMSLNGLTSPSLKLGQKVYLPANREVAGYAPEPASLTKPAAPSARTYEPATAEPAPTASVSPEVAARYQGTYTVKPGESLYSIARSHRVLFSELQQVNGITDPRKVKPGAVLKVPGAAPSRTAEGPPPSSAANTNESAPAAPERYGDATSRQPTIINGQKRVASLNDTANDAAPSPAAADTQAPSKVAVAAPTAAPEVADSVKLRWPAEGRVISSFGGRPDGTHNDGVNLAVPLGTDVHAAESGVVVYSGSELKGYGNLILLRHDNGWVTAYAHNDELDVKRGDKIQRGQVIAKAGKTGSVDQPQVHFELRQGSRPVDPIPYLEKR